MNLGIIGTALAGAGVGLGESGKELGAYTSKLSLQDEAAKAMAQRDAVLESYASAREERGYAHTEALEASREAGANTRLGISEAGSNTRLGISEAGANTRNFNDIGARAQEASARRNFEAEQNDLQRGLSREQIASHELVQAATNANALKIAQIGGSVTQDKEGNVLWVGKDGKAAQIMDPANPTKPLQAFKDLTPAAKAYAEVLKAELTDLDRQELNPLTMGDPTAQARLTQRRGQLNGELINVLRGGIGEAGKAIGGKNGWDSTTGQIYRNGQVIGTAKTEVEARNFIAAAPPQPAIDALNKHPTLFEEFKQKYPAAAKFFEPGKAPQPLQPSQQTQQGQQGNSSIPAPSRQSMLPGQEHIKLGPRGGYTFDAPPRSALSKLNGRYFGTRQEAMNALDGVMNSGFAAGFNGTAL